MVDKNGKPWGGEANPRAQKSISITLLQIDVVVRESPQFKINESHPPVEEKISLPLFHVFCRQTNPDLKEPIPHLPENTEISVQ